MIRFDQQVSLCLTRGRALVLLGNPLGCCGCRRPPPVFSMTFVPKTRKDPLCDPIREGQFPWPESMTYRRPHDLSSGDVGSVGDNRAMRSSKSHCSCSGWIVGFSKVRSAIILGCCRIGVWLIAAISDFFENVAGKSSLSGVLQTCPLTLSAVPLLTPCPKRLNHQNCLTEPAGP
jgi:hypothetical protein